MSNSPATPARYLDGVYASLTCDFIGSALHEAFNVLSPDISNIDPDDRDYNFNALLDLALWHGCNLNEALDEAYGIQESERLEKLIRSLECITIGINCAITSDTCDEPKVLFIYGLASICKDLSKRIDDFIGGD